MCRGPDGIDCGFRAARRVGAAAGAFGDCPARPTPAGLGRRHGMAARAVRPALAERVVVHHRPEPHGGYRENPGVGRAWPETTGVVLGLKRPTSLKSEPIEVGVAEF